MDYPRVFLYNRIMTNEQDSFRSVYPDGSSDIAGIRVIGFRQLFRGGVWSPNGSGDFFLFLFEAGMRINAEKEPTTRPTVLIQSPGTPIRHSKTGGFLRTWIRMRAGMIGERANAVGVPTDRPIPVEYPGEIEGLIRQLHREIRHPKHSVFAIQSGLIDLILQTLRREAEVPEPLVGDAVRRARDFIESHYLQKIDLEQIGRAAWVSIPHLCRLFRQQLSTSPMRYVTELRLEHARELLTDPGSTLAVVATESGFANEYYFSRCFRKNLGITPGEYRRATDWTDRRHI